MNLEEALVAFGKSRSSELTPAIEELGRRAAEGFTPPTAKKNLEFHQAWKRLAVDPTKRTWCMGSILDKLPKLIDGKEHSSGDKSDAVAERIALLVKLDPDPRIARAMLAIHELRAPVAGFMDAIEAMAHALVRHADEAMATLPAIGELAEMEEVAAIFKQTPLPKPGVLDAKTKARAKQIRPPAKRDTTALFAAVYAAPDADEPREVLADALQEAGDPRGEFIALQLREHRGDASEELRARAQALVDKHGKAWLGPVRPIVYRAEMRRGFLHRLELAGSWSTNKWKQLGTEPMLATVEELVAGQATGKPYAEFLAGPIAKTIRSIDVFDDVIWKVVTSTPMPRLREIACQMWKRKDYRKVFLAEVLPWLVSHREITRLGVTNQVIAKLPAPLIARLTDLRTSDDLTGLAKHWAAWKHLHTLTTGFTDTMSLVREGKREYARIVASRYGWAISVKGMPPTIKRVEVLNNAKQAKALAAKVGKRLEVVALPSPSGTITGVK